MAVPMGTRDCPLTGRSTLASDRPVLARFLPVNPSPVLQCCALVRDQGRLTLLDAVRKMSLMSAQRLEAATETARSKGRLQVGADADIVVFDPAHFEDRATYQHPDLPSVGTRYVFVAGTLIVDGGRILEGVAPGRPILAHRHTP